LHSADSPVFPAPSLSIIIRALAGLRFAGSRVVPHYAPTPRVRMVQTDLVSLVEE